MQPLIDNDLADLAEQDKKDKSGWYYRIDGEEVYRPSIFMGEYKKKNKFFRNIKINKKWVEWR